MKDKLLNQRYGISSRTELREISADEVAIVRCIKSRIIRKDALRIIELAQQIQAVDCHKKVRLICNNNICSKSLTSLADASIYVEFTNDVSSNTAH